MKKIKKSPKPQMNLRAPEYLIEWIDTAAKAAGLTQVAFVEKCVTLNTDAVITMSDDDRAKLRLQLKKLQENAKLQK